jgi:hypothetical protein
LGERRRAGTGRTARLKPGPMWLRLKNRMQQGTGFM